MKRFLSLLLILALTAGLTACSAEPQPSEPTAAPAPEAPAVITSVDGFLAALQPGATILLGEGEFHLDSASDYGNSGSPFYTWKDLGLGDYELVLQNLDGVTIQGSGQDKTTLVRSPRSVNVLSLEGCTNLTLKAMTMGHTEQAEACEGGVLRLDSSRNLHLEELGLFGCGSIGIHSYRSKNLTVQSCNIYECSISAVQLSESSNVSLRDSSFYSLGGDLPASTVLSVYGGENISISGCRISGNYLQTFADILHTSGVAFRENQFLSNRIAYAAFSFQQQGILMENNLFQENSVRTWYTSDSAPAVDPAGQPVIFEETAEPAPVTPGVPVPVTTGEQKTVKVKTADEFLAAIAPDTCIQLEGELLDLSTAKSYPADLTENAEGPNMGGDQTPESPYYYWARCYDGPSLVITGVSNFTIQAKGKDRSTHTISAVPRYADVLTFENCTAVTLSGFTAGHTQEPGYCSGGVLRFRNCQDVLVENCGMYGCGTVGFSGESSRDIQIVNSEIYECSYYGVELRSCENVVISGTTLRDIGQEDWGFFFSFYDSRNVTLDGTPLDGNYQGN